MGAQGSCLRLVTSQRGLLVSPRWRLWSPRSLSSCTARGRCPARGPRPRCFSGLSHRACHRAGASQPPCNEASVFALFQRKRHVGGASFSVVCVPAEHWGPQPRGSSQLTPSSSSVGLTPFRSEVVAVGADDARGVCVCVHAMLRMWVTWCDCMCMCVTECVCARTCVCMCATVGKCVTRCNYARVQQCVCVTPCLCTPVLSQKTTHTISALWGTCKSTRWQRARTHSVVQQETRIAGRLEGGGTALSASVRFTLRLCQRKESTLLLVTVAAGPAWPPALKSGDAYRVRQTSCSSRLQDFCWPARPFCWHQARPRCGRTDGGRFTASPLSLRLGLHLRSGVPFTFPRIVSSPSRGCSLVAHSLFSKASGTRESCISKSRHRATGELRVRAQGTASHAHLRRRSSRAGGHSRPKDTRRKQTHVPASPAPHGCACHTRVRRTSAGLPPTPEF